MLSRIRDFIAASLAPGEAPAHSAHGRHLAAAALLIEVARADYRHDPREQVTMREMLHRCFGLSHEELDTLLALAEAEAHEATSSYAFTRVINCLLYTSDAADERSSVDLGGRRIIKKKKTLDSRVKQQTSNNRRTKTTVTLARHYTKQSNDDNRE